MSERAYADTRPAAPAGATTLPARYYTDPVLFEREKDRIHRAMWNAACPAADLAAAGDYRLVEIAGDSLIVVRDAAGALRAHHNVCRHRGTRLVEAEAGRLPGSIRCPYHAWTYGLDGALRSAPHMDRVEGFSVSRYPLAPAACGEWGGIVFVRVAAEGPGLLDQLGPAAERLAPWGLERLRSAHTETYEVDANWKLVVQNFSECLHCPVIHPQLQRLSHYLSGENHPVTPGTVGSTMDLAAGVETLSTDARLVAAPLPGLSSADRRRVAYDILLPNLMLCLHPELRGAVPDAAAGGGPHHHPLRLAVQPGRPRRGRVRSRPRRRVLGHHEPAGLARLRTRPGRDRVERLPPRPLLEPRRPALGDRPPHPRPPRGGVAAGGRPALRTSAARPPVPPERVPARSP